MIIFTLKIKLSIKEYLTMINNRYYPVLTLLVTAALAAITLILLSNNFLLIGTLAALATVSFEIWKFTLGRIR